RLAIAAAEGGSDREPGRRVLLGLDTSSDQSPLDGDKPRPGGMEFEDDPEVLLGALRSEN
ncbi:MAG TPA: hypothetical protein VGN42_29025, partial [Pirellulales bacterium]|nr:hypothetical protein [Pirellulales bacterium]